MPPAGPPPGNGASPDSLTGEQVGRLAEMIADGRYEFPSDLTTADRERLAREVKRRLRERLVRLVARAIARHLRRDAGRHSEE
jgi:hypothetical protein